MLGGLFFGHPQPGMFTERARSACVVGIAAQAAIAIDNARLFQPLSEREAELEKLQRASARAFLESERAARAEASG